MCYSEEFKIFCKFTCPLKDLDNSYLFFFSSFENFQDILCRRLHLFKNQQAICETCLHSLQHYQKLRWSNRTLIALFPSQIKNKKMKNKQSFITILYSAMIFIKIKSDLYLYTKSFSDLLPNSNYTPRGVNIKCKVLNVYFIFSYDFSSK